ncbi:MAG: 3D domain-containing protein [Candidatus Hydrogenedentota bacterium]
MMKVSARLKNYFTFGFQLPRSRWRYKYNYNNYNTAVIAFFIPVLIGLVLSGFRSTGDLRNVTIIADGRAINFSTTKNFVGDALTAANIEYDKDDIVMPPAMASLVDGEVITLRRVKREVLEKEVLLPYETKILENNRLRIGSEVELRAGSPGMRIDRVERDLIDGNLIEEKVVASDVLMEPISRKIYKGTRTTGSTIKSLTMAATAYTAGAESCWPSVDGLTCVLKQAGYGVAAVDPRVINLGTRLYIEGYGFAVASDIGGAIKGNRIDLFMSNVKTAREFGKRTVKVHLLD